MNENKRIDCIAVQKTHLVFAIRSSTKCIKKCKKCLRTRSNQFCSATRFFDHPGPRGSTKKIRWGIMTGSKACWFDARVLANNIRPLIEKHLGSSGRGGGDAGGYPPLQNGIDLGRPQARNPIDQQSRQKSHVVKMITLRKNQSLCHSFIYSGQKKYQGRVTDFRTGGNNNVCIPG